MRKVIPLAVAGGVLVASGGVFGAAQALAKDIEVSQDGVPVKVRTWDSTVGDVLDKQGITVGERDLVAPSPATKITDGQQISVRYGREVRLNIDGQSETLWTTALTLDEVLAERSIRDESRMSTSRNAAIGREGLTVDIQTAKKTTLVVAGESREFISPAPTVEELLKDAQVELTPDDTTDPALDAPIVEDLTVTVNKNENRETTKTVDVPFKTVRKNTSKLPAGTQKVETEGVPGKAVEVWVERFENGKSVSNERTSTRVEKEPVNKVVLVGTRSNSASPSPSARNNSAAPRTSAPAPAPAQDLSPANGASCVASNYWQGQMTANGEVFNPNAMTTAHKTLPFNTRVKVTNPRNGKTVIVRVNDRGPFIAGRCLDLSRAAFAQIGDPGQGIMTVNYEVL
ncbi:septal ring lytic transglycosylase RlpA family protein [Granulicoccus sp. GXG6511]|uniref:septal ring lytic transglycosylase RlpA family protein n=1 Tax=Granulicoccus sp. GXG6511 TaxID=3381351 RepID=UPI003D7E6524